VLAEHDAASGHDFQLFLGQLVVRQLIARYVYGAVSDPVE